jgi:predicted ArsR family transcriptional regulator
MPASLYLEPTDSRAAEILALVARRGPLTVADLTVALGVTTTAVRQQVNRLLWQGWLERQRRPRRPGRPADVFSLSDQARRALADGVGQFARLLIEEVGESEGAERLAEVLTRVSRRLAQEMESVAGSGPPRERIGRLVQSLQQRGTVAEVEPAESGLRVSLHTCPFHGLGEARGTICETERETLGHLAGGPVRLRKSMFAGDCCCEFEIGRAPEESGAGDSASASGAAPGH